MVRVAAVQHDIAWEDREATLAALAPRVAAAAADGADLIALTEMFPTGFSMRTHLTAEPLDGPTSRWLSERAAEHGATLVGSVAEHVTDEPAEGDRPANTLIVARPDGSRERYRKLHPFTFAGERERFAAGEETITVDVGGLRVTPLVCFDLRFANLFWDRAAGTDCFLVVANWPAARRAHWRALLRARAIENQAHVVGVNRIGTGGNSLDYAGDSMFVHPDGEIVADAARVPTTLTVDLDPQAVAETRQAYPFADDRRDMRAVAHREVT